MSKKVIPFHKVCNLTVKRNVLPYQCKHKDMLYVDPDERVLQCGECKAFVDPFDIVMGWLNQDVRLARNCGVIRTELNALRKEKRQLEKEVKNLKAQCKYHTAKMSPDTTKDGK